MATDLDQAYLRWSREADTGQNEELSIAQMLDHGSISFGRYAVESLSWEKRSVFTHNKLHDELEKFKGPGLVAKKKAYFEEYYKRIRNLKSVEDDNQQAEGTLDSGAQSSISSKTGDEDIALQIQNPQEQVNANCSVLFLSDVSREQDISCNNANNVFPEICPEFDLSSIYSEEVDRVNTSNGAFHITNSESGVIVSNDKATLRKITEEKLENNSSEASQLTHTNYGEEDLKENFGINKDLSSCEPCSSSQVICSDPYLIKMNSSQPCQLTHTIYDGTVTSVASPDIGEENSEGKLGIKKDSSSCESYSSSQITCTDPSLSEKKSLTIPGSEYKSDELKTLAKKNKDLKYDVAMKEYHASTVKNMKARDEKKLERIKIPHRTNYLQQMATVSRDKIANRTDTILPKKNKASASPCRSNLPVNTTVPRPFSFFTEKRAVIEKRGISGKQAVTEGQPSSRLNSSGSVKANSNMKVILTSTNHVKNKLLQQDVSKTKCTESSKKITNLERNRLQEFLCRKPSVLETNHSKSNAIDGSKEIRKPRLQESPCRKPSVLETDHSKSNARDRSTERRMSRSINLPPSDKHHFRHGSYSGSRLTEIHQVKMVNGASETCVSNPVNPPTSRKLMATKAETNKTSPGASDPVIAMKKPRQVVKRWR